jgi:hypothetical protein
VNQCASSPWSEQEVGELAPGRDAPAVGLFLRPDSTRRMMTALAPSWGESDVYHPAFGHPLVGRVSFAPPWIGKQKTPARGGTEVSIGPSWCGRTTGLATPSSVSHPQRSS